MANTQSAHIASVKGSPPVISKHDAGDGSPSVTISSTVEWTPATGDTLELLQLPVNAIIHSLELASDDLATTSITVDVGLYENGAGTAAGTVIDLDCYADGVNWDGVTAFTNYRYSALGIETAGDKVQENATGFTEAEALEQGSVTLAVTCAAATGGQAGTVSYIVNYTSA